MAAIVTLKNISKLFYKNINKNKKENNLVLAKINLSIHRGELIKLFGANGSGKSTLLKIISNLYVPDSGKIEFNFNNPQKKISYLSTNFRSFYLRLSVMDNLKFYGSLYGIKPNILDERIEVLSKFFNCKDFLYKKVSSLSDGQKKRIMLIRCFIKDPELVLCDEAYNSLDKTSKELLKKYIEKIIKNGKSVVWVSHMDDEFENINTQSYTIKEKELVRK